MGKIWRGEEKGMEGEAEIVMVFYISRCEFNTFKENIIWSCQWWEGQSYIMLDMTRQNKRIWELSILKFTK